MSEQGSQKQYAELSDLLSRTRDDVAALQAGAEAAGVRADHADDRAETQGHRVDALAARFDLDRVMIAQLQADGLLQEEQVAHLREALRTSRQIGAAIGLVMASFDVDEAGAFELLSQASQDTNRKLNVVAHEVVSKRDASGLAAR